MSIYPHVCAFQTVVSGLTLYNCFIKLPRCAVSLSLPGKWSRHLIKRGGCRLRLWYENAGAAELWVPVAFLTAERPLWPSHGEHSKPSNSHSKPHWNVSSPSILPCAPHYSFSSAKLWSFCGLELILINLIKGLHFSFAHLGERTLQMVIVSVMMTIPP